MGEAGGSFRVYRGISQVDLIFLAEVPAAAGVQSYAVVDHLAPAEGCVYQLRYRGDGREVVLESALCRSVDLIPRATVPALPNVAAVLTVIASASEPEAGGLQLAQPGNPDPAWCLVPPVPPPENGA